MPIDIDVLIQWILNIIGVLIALLFSDSIF